MRRPAAAIGFSVLLSFMVAASAGAQTLQEGTWTGTMTPPGGPTGDVTYSVTHEGGKMAVVLKVPGTTLSARFNDVELKDNALTFWWEPDVRVDCVLTRREDGSFAGDCSSPGGQKGQLTMVPPSEG